MPYIFRKLEQVEKVKAFEAHGGSGTIRVQQILGCLKNAEFPGFPEDFEAPVNFVHRVELPPGSSIGMHPHENNEEFYFIIKGLGTMIADDESFQMEEGSICLIKKGSVHAFENNSDQDLIALVMEVEFKKNI